MRTADMNKNSDELTQRVWLELEKIYGGDRDRMREACRAIRKPFDDDWALEYKIMKQILEAINPEWNFQTMEDLGSTAKKLFSSWDEVTAKLSLSPKRPPQTPEAYNQLTLDFSVTTEPSPPAPGDELSEKPAPSPGEGEKRSLGVFPNESIFLAISREGMSKGWLTPQYKFKVGLCGNSTTTKQFGAPRRTYGPYWVFCWNRPKRSDGRYYLGKFESPKFQHFCEIWESSEDLSEILRRLYAR